MPHIRIWRSRPFDPAQRAPWLGLDRMWGAIFEFDTWEDAMAWACAIEKHRGELAVIRESRKMRRGLLAWFINLNLDR